MFAARLLTRAAVARPATFMAVRSFTAPSAPMMKDILKDLYIEELKNYKPAPEAKGIDTSTVKTFAAPAAPSTPVVDAAADLSAWESANVEAVEAVSEVDVEEEEEEEEEEAEEAHH
ncbi:hypothetical protein BGZ83_004323 [Gryganskiella cystojenkinii]|nr:hypothetical protein BGZ83_004323 [Gryganskiella cystojenkinii]